MPKKKRKEAERLAPAQESEVALEV